MEHCEHMSRQGVDHEKAVHHGFLGDLILPSLLPRMEIKCTYVGPDKSFSYTSIR